MSHHHTHTHTHMLHTHTHTHTHANINSTQPDTLSHRLDTCTLPKPNHTPTTHSNQQPRHSIHISSAGTKGCMIMPCRGVELLWEQTSSLSCWFCIPGSGNEVCRYSTIVMMSFSGTATAILRHGGL